MLDPTAVGQANGLMDQIIANLNSAIDQLDSKASEVNALASSVGWSLLGPIGATIDAVTSPTSDARSAIRSGLNTMRTITNRLNGPDRQDVLNGDLNISKWSDAAGTVLQGIQGLSAQLDDGTIYSNMVAATRQSLEDLQHLLKAAAPYVAGLGMGLGVIIAGVLGLVLLNSWFQGGGGHSSRGVAGLPARRGGRRRRLGARARRPRFGPRGKRRALKSADTDADDGGDGGEWPEDDGETVY